MPDTCFQYIYLKENVNDEIDFSIFNEKNKCGFLKGNSLARI